MADNRKPPERHCQCKVGCNNPPLDKEPFCEYHKIHGCPIVANLSGSEPSIEILDEYNKDPAIRRSHNCFAFAALVKDLEKIDKCRETKDCNVGFHSPGRKSGHTKLTKSCSDIFMKTVGDVPDAKPSTFEEACPIGYSKVAVVVDEKNDFHYYLQIDDGKWVHKPGGRKATTVDSNGSEIIDPELAGRYYPAEYEGDHTLNYDSFCSYICFPREKEITLKGGKRASAYRRTVSKAKKRRSARTRRLKKGSKSGGPRQRRV